MKKYFSLLILLGVILFPSGKAKAAVPDGAYFFENGQGYNINGEQTFFCLGIVSQTCYTVEGEYAFVRELVTKIDELNQKIDNLQDSVNQLQSMPVPIPVPPVPAPTPEPTPAPTPVGQLSYADSYSNNFKNILETTASKTSIRFGFFVFGGGANGNTKVIFNGQTVLTKDGNSIPFLNDDSDFKAVNTGGGVVINNLAPDTEYSYQIYCDGLLYTKYIRTAN